MMNFIYINHDIRNKKNAPEESYLCKKQVYREVGIPEEYYLPIVMIFLCISPGFVSDLLSLI
ncbi:hypothetical protein CMU86_09460 [Elizabethkingia anophelis]|nr:hypothetical protein [Elizabethkingia anophelis]